MTVAELQALQNYFEYYLVIRPEQLSDIPAPVEPPVDIPDEPTPEVPSAPQTGYVMGIGGLAAAAVAAGAVAVVAGKKAYNR